MLVLANCVAVLVHGQVDSVAALHSSLRDVLGTDTMVQRASLATEITDQLAHDLHEAPGIVTVLQAEEIQAAGARDLQEALQLLPGVVVARDVDDALGIAIRGNWAHEGKCLVMLNGTYLNENSYGTYALGQRAGLDNVSRIEMISGPGSVNYGGVAALGVINIVTKDAIESEGLTVTMQNGISGDRWSRNALEAYGAHRSGRTAITYSVFLDRGLRATRKDTLPDGRAIDRADSTQIHSGQFTFGLRSGRTTAQLIAGEYTHHISDKGSEVLRRDLLADLGHRFDIGRYTTVDVRGGGRVQLPWSNINDTSMALLNTNTIDQRLSLAGAITHTLSPQVTLRGGVQGYHESSRFVCPRPENVFTWNGSPALRTSDIATYMEMLVKHRLGNLTLGGRYEVNSAAGDAFAPRLAYTRPIGRFHLKLLLSRAFKLPTLQNLNNGPADHSITGEMVRTRELELGYRIASGTELVANLFSVDIRDPIVYVYEEESGTDNYLNRSRSGTSGADVKFRWRKGRFNVNAHHSYYAVDRRRTDLPEAELEVDAGAYQAVPQHVTNIATWYRTRDGLQVGLVLDHRSKVLSYGTAASGDLVLITENADAVVDLNLRWAPKAIPDLILLAGCRNVADTRRSIHSAYANGSAPLPFMGREWTFGISYRIQR